MDSYYAAGCQEVIDKVRQYLLNCIEEWNNLGDRKYELANIQVYNHIRKCLDDLEDYENSILGAESLKHGKWKFKETWRDTEGDLQYDYICPECGRIITIDCINDLKDYPYCHCGAKMEAN